MFDVDPEGELRLRATRSQADNDYLCDLTCDLWTSQATLAFTDAFHIECDYDARCGEPASADPGATDTTQFTSLTGSGCLGA